MTSHLPARDLHREPSGRLFREPPSGGYLTRPQPLAGNHRVFVLAVLCGCIDPRFSLTLLHTPLCNGIGGTCGQVLSREE